VEDGTGEGVQALDVGILRVVEDPGGGDDDVDLVGDTPGGGECPLTLVRYISRRTPE
jgi:hypothetical protein